MLLTVVPRSLLGVGREVLRHVLKRPVVGIAAAATAPDGRWLLVRRADTGTWALPGGTVEWGETLRAALARELLEEAGVESSSFERVVGVFGRPDRDLRFHAVTIVARVSAQYPARSPLNPLEIREVGLFEADELPEELAMGMTDMLKTAREGGDVVLE